MRTSFSSHSRSLAATRDAFSRTASAASATALPVLTATRLAPVPKP